MTFLRKSLVRLNRNYKILHLLFFARKKMFGCKIHMFCGQKPFPRISLVAKYHRRSGPRLRHDDYRNLSADDRIRVSKLAALLRVADALERAHTQRIRDFSVEIFRHKIQLNLEGVSDVTVERLAMQSKGDLFHDVFGLEVVIAEAP